MIARRAVRAFVMAAAVGALAACSSSPKTPQPAPLATVANLMGTSLIWSAQVGAGHAGLQPLVAGGRVWAASASGSVVALDASSGVVAWRAELNTPLAAGVGSDGETAAVVTRENQLVALRDGREVWRVRLNARSFTAPLVAGKRVFVLTADRSISAYDSANGARLWATTRPADPLVLNQPGALLAVGDSLVAGVSGRLAGFNPDNGAVRWEVPVASPRGTNEIERLVDIVGPLARLGASVCARAYGAVVGCVDASRGTPVWTKPAQGTTGVHGDDRLLFGSESDGRFVAWRRDSGEPAWTIERFKHRELSAPLALGRVVAVGDNTGLVHLVSREDGSEMTRLSTDGSPVLVQPVLAGDALVVQTRNGGLYAWRPQ